MTPRIHPTAIVENGVEIGAGTSVWDNAHLRGPSKIGSNCIIGGKSYIAYGVEIGDFVKINSFVYIPNAVRIGNGVMISAGTIFTNDITPRATDPDISELLDSGPQDSTLPTFVGDGATIGAGSKISGGISIGKFAMIGMGSVVTKDVGAFHLVFGNPAKLKGAVCKCGQVLVRGSLEGQGRVTCPKCGRQYSYQDGVVSSELESVS